MSTKRFISDDPVFALHEYNVDPDGMAIYLMGEESYAEGADGDWAEEPGVEYSMANRFIRNMQVLMRNGKDGKGKLKPILVHMKTCFSRKTPITTRDGHKKICEIKVGDLVLTHKGRYCPVINIMSQMYEGEMTRIYYGRKNHDSTSLRATSRHPILVERGTNKMWIQLKDVLVGDTIFVESTECSESGEMIPYWRNRKNYNCERLRRKRRGSQQMHLENDILPYCEKLKSRGWKAVPVGAGVIPDIIGFKNGKIVAFEIEKMGGKSLEVKKEKYTNAAIKKYVDKVVWHCISKKKSIYPWYEADKKTGFVKVKVTGKECYHTKYRQRVYNLTIAEDNSYVANKVVVHNCGGDWSEGMAIYDAIMACPNPIVILNYTHARSMSSLIFQAADRRVMMPHSYFMFHEGDCLMGGTEKQVRSFHEFFKTLTPIMMGIYADSMKEKGKYSKSSKKTIKQMLIAQMDKKEDVYLTAKETVAWGLADEIFDGNWEKLKKTKVKK